MAESFEKLGDLEMALGAMHSYLHLTPEDDPYRRRAMAAVWEWQSALGREQARSDASGLAGGRGEPGRTTMVWRTRSMEVRNKVLKQILIPLALLALTVVEMDRAWAADVFAGQAVYEASCANCHGLDGKPVLPGTPDFTRGAGLMAPDSDLVPVMKTGKGLMPGYEHILNEKDILNVLAYTRTLQR